MKYSFETKMNSKSWARMIQLNMNIKKGLKCSVATIHPGKAKRDFEYMTGNELILTPVIGGGNMYKASLKK